MTKHLKRNMGGFNYMESQVVALAESDDTHRKQRLSVRVRNTVHTLCENSRNYLMKKFGLELKNIIGLLYGHTEVVDRF